MKHINIFVAPGLIALIVITLGLCFPGWWFWYNDEFIYLSSGKCAQTWSDLLSFFIDGDTHHYTQSSPGTVFYRPINCIIATLEYWFFDTQAWWYHITNIMVHALNASLIFYACQAITSTLPSLCGALFFAFHPLIGYEFGRVDCLHIYLSTTCILTCYLLIRQWFTTQKTLYYACFCIIFAFSMLNRETTIIIPILLSLGFWISYRKPKIFITPWSLLGLFLAIRFYMLNTVAKHSANIWQTIIKHTAIWPTLILQTTYDFFGLSWLPGGFPVFRISILAICIIGTFLCFQHSKHKLWLTLAAFAAYAMLWPCFILGGYCMRYNYEALPFMIFFFAGCWKALPNNVFKNTIGLVIWGYIIFLITLCVYCFSLREHEFKRVHNRFERFITTLTKHKNRTFCFVHCPGRPFGNGVGKALNIFAGIQEKAVYHDEVSVVHAPYLINKGFVRVPYFFPASTKIKQAPLKLPHSVTQTDPLIVSWDFENASFFFL